MDLLIVVDMHELFVGENAKYKFPNRTQLLQNINKKILETSKRVVYIKSIRKQIELDLVEGLERVSDFVFTKEKSSSFTNPKFCTFFEQEHPAEVEVIGIDGNCCVKSTALDARKHGVNVVIPFSCIGVLNETRWIKTKEKLRQAGVELVEINEK